VELRISRRVLLAGALGALVAGCGDEQPDEAATLVATSAASSFSSSDLLVDAGWLAAHIHDADLRLIDGSSLTDYRNGHTPSARHVWWQDTVELNNPVYGMIVGRAGRDQILRDAGVGEGTTVVAYDRDGGTYAARLIWMLQGDGFTGGRLLDGGLQAWVAAGGALTLDEPPAGESSITPGSNEEILAHAHDIADRVGESGLVILDTRSASERQETWNGKLRRGMVPGSAWLPRERFVAAGPVPYLLGPDELLARLREAGISGELATTEFIVYGLHGTLASLPWLALSALGARHVRVYDGSWSEWGADASLPIVPLPD
jgi:thiosulfate/3-mercaptopyruvate sulfurtransferase